MKTKLYLPLIVVGISIASCLKKPSSCRCSYMNGDKILHDMRGVNNMADSCDVLDQEAEANQGNCILK
jgi:hypothetical protein